MPAHRELVRFSVSLRRDVHGWFGSPLFTSPKASGVLLALQKLFFGLRLPLSSPGKARNTIPILPLRATAAIAATIFAQAPVTLDSWLVAKILPVFQKRNKALDDFLFWEEKSGKLLNEVLTDLPGLSNQMGQQTEVFCFVTEAAGDDCGMYADFICKCNCIFRQQGFLSLG